MKKILAKIQKDYETQVITEKEYGKRLDELCGRHGTEYIANLLMQVIKEG